jgi:SOS-response transcriptional repressor LexA
MWGFSPTMRDICTALKINSTNAVSDHLKALRKKGYLEDDKSLATRCRVMRLTPRAKQLYSFFTTGAERDCIVRISNFIEGFPENSKESIAYSCKTPFDGARMVCNIISRILKESKKS